MSNPKPSASRNAALPELPLASMENFKFNDSPRGFKMVKHIQLISNENSSLYKIVGQEKAAMPHLIWIAEMFDPTTTDSVGRFDGLADLYDRYRPDYPRAAIDNLLGRCGLTPGRLLVDVGCGTGISSRRMASCGLEVIGIEPNAEMRRRAESVAVEPGVRPPSYREGRGEATGLPCDFADAVLAAQAFHWFPFEASLREFYRILKPGGWVALIWNERDRQDEFTRTYGQELRRHSVSTSADAPTSDCGEYLLKCDTYSQRERVEFPHSQEVNEEQLLGRSLSISFAPREPEIRQQFVRALHELFNRFQQGGKVILRYRTTIYTGRKPLVRTAAD
jgi:ubiquinone/menaquinone biosynthesis C-methylase UbiE